MRRIALIAPLVLVACGPTPKQLCEHTISLRDGKLGAPSAEERPSKVAECVTKTDAKKQKMSDEQWKGYAACVLGADRPMKAALCSATGKVKEKAGQALKGIKAKVEGDAAAAE